MIQSQVVHQRSQLNQKQQPQQSQQHQQMMQQKPYNNISRYDAFFQEQNFPEIAERYIKFGGSEPPRDQHFCILYTDYLMGKKLDHNQFEAFKADTMNKKRTFYKRTDFSKVLSALDGTNPDQAQRAKKLQKNITSRVGLKVARYNRYKERQRTSSQKAHIQLAQQHPQFKSFPTVQTKQPFMLQNTKTMILPPQIQQQAMLLKQQQPPMQLKPQIKLQVEARQQAPVQQVQQIPKENQQGLPVIQQANVSKPQSGRSMVTPIEQISGPVNSAWDQQTSALHRMQFQQQMHQQPQSLSLQLPQQGLQVPQPQLQRKYQPMQIKVQPQPQQLQLQQQALVQHQPPSLPSQQKQQQQQPPQPPQQKYQQRQPQQQQQP